MSEQKVRMQLHQSGLEMMSRCPQQFYYRYVMGMKRRPHAFLICGTATDKGVTTDLTHKIETGELEQESVILDVARDAVEFYPDKESIELDEEDQGKSVETVLSETKDKVVRLLKGHHSFIAPVIRPSQVARKFSINLDGFLRSRAKEMHERAEAMTGWAKRTMHAQAAHLNAVARDGIDLVGEMDIVERFGVLDGPEILTIRDTKTSKKSPSADLVHESDQLTTYALAASVIDKKLPDKVMLDYLVDLKGGVKPMTVESVRTQQHLSVALNRIVAAVITLRSGVFTPANQTSWWCSIRFCAYAESCPYFKQVKTVVTDAELVGGEVINAEEVRAITEASGE